MPNRARLGKSDKVLCGLSGCGAQLGRIAGYKGEKSFSVAPEFTEQTGEHGTYYEFPQRRQERYYRGEEPLHHVPHPEEFSYIGNKKWRRKYDPSLTGVKTPIWRGVDLPTLVRCPNCKLLYRVEHEVIDPAVQ